MTRCTCQGGILNPGCDVDHAVEAEREESEIEDVMRAMRSLQYVQDLAPMFDKSVDDFLLAEIETEARHIGWGDGRKHRVAAAHIVKRRMQRDHADMYPDHFDYSGRLAA